MGVSIRYRQDAVDVEVVDDGSGRGDLVAGGYGLIGMRERVVLHGGDLEVGNRDGAGFRVRARLPLAEVS